MKKLFALILVPVIILSLMPFTTVFAELEGNYSAWAEIELQKADQMDLIPDTLNAQDFTKSVNRAEFAAIAVKLYENLSGGKADAATLNPFTDTDDEEVLKAYNLGLTAGTAADKFSPDNLLTREQAATMLIRVLKAAYIPGWILAEDNDYTLNYEKAADFADDSLISDWAEASVYFASANGIIFGTGENNFSPKGNASRQEAIIIAVRVAENLKDKPLDYTGPIPEENPALDTLKTVISETLEEIAGEEGWCDIEITEEITVGKGEILNIPDNIHLDFIHGEESRTAIVVENGGTLIIGEEAIIGAGGALVIESGNIVYTRFQFGTAIATNGDIIIPEDTQLICDGGNYDAIIVESGTFTVKGTLTLDGRNDIAVGFAAMAEGKMIVADGGTVELFEGNIPQEVIFEAGAKVIVDENSVYSIKTGVDADGETWENIIGIKGIDEPNIVYTYDGNEWVK